MLLIIKSILLQHITNRKVNHFFHFIFVDDKLRFFVQATNKRVNLKPADTLNSSVPALPHCSRLVRK